MSLKNLKKILVTWIALEKADLKSCEIFILKMLMTELDTSLSNLL